MPISEHHTILSLEGLHAGYGELQVLFNIELKIPEGSLVAIIGNNGAGKTTLLKAISGLIPYSGRITFKNEEIQGLPAQTLVNKGIIHIPEGRRIFPELTVDENLAIGAWCNPKKEKENREKVFSLFPRLAERCRQLGGTMSGGEQQMLAIARGLMGNPSILLLDEPGLGLSPLYTQMVFEVITAINKSGTTIILVEQNVKRALSASNSGCILENGHIVFQSSSDILKDSPEVRKAYLGL